MTSRIEVSGPGRVGLAGIVLILLAGAWLAPAMVSSFLGSSGHSYSYLRGGHVVQHKTNLTGHWITSAKGSYRSMPFLALAGETVVIDHGVNVLAGSVSVRIRRYVLDIVPEPVWGKQIRKSVDGQLTMSVPASGIYCLEIVYIGFEGSVSLDWVVS